MDKFSELIKNGYKRAWELGGDEQSGFLSLIAQIRGARVEDLKRAGAFFIPNDDFLAVVCGDVIRDWEFDCYLEDGTCRWNNYLLIPIEDIGGNVVALCGFNPFLYLKAHETHDWSINYYQYTSNRIFKKGRYVYAMPGIMEKAIIDGYVFVTDGIFDTISVTGAGFNAWALMGSSLTQENVVLMRFVKRVILIPDNDDAGVKLLRQMRKRIRNVEVFRQEFYKDIDGLLTSNRRENAIKELSNIAKGNICARRARFYKPEDKNSTFYTSVMT